MQKGKSKNAKASTRRHSKKQLQKRKPTRAKSDSRSSKKKSGKTGTKRAGPTRTIPQYRIAKLERYYGDMKAYVYKSVNRNQTYSPIYSEKNQKDFERLFRSVSKKVLNSPLPYSKVRVIQLAIEGMAKVSTKEGENEFPFWKASVKSVKKCDKKIFFATLPARKESLKRKLEDFANEGEKMEYAGTDSNTAEEYYLESMRIYAELPKRVSADKKTRSKKKAKNRRR